LLYLIDYSAEGQDHLKSLTANQRALVVDVVERQLGHQPTVETRNRKKMQPNPIAPWELRIRNLRVYYEIVETESEPIVSIRGIGVQIRDRVWLGGEEVQFR
jgi:mRNA-degrading endonuclease RelE of RelBE toxin-antitoxin system